MVRVRRRFFSIGAGIALLSAATVLGAASLLFLADAPKKARQAATASRLPIVASSAQAEASAGKDVLIEGRISSANLSTTLPTWVPSREAPSVPRTVGGSQFVVHERAFAAYWREPARQESSGVSYGRQVRVVPRGLRVELAPGLDARMGMQTSTPSSTMSR